MFEKKRGKRFLASVMALVMLLSLAPVGALAAKGGNESYPTEEKLKIEDVETPYELSGESPNNFTEARYIWEKDNEDTEGTEGTTVYLAFTVSNGKGDGTGNSFPIQSATASEEILTVDHTLYKYLQFGSGDPIPATGKNGEEARWQIATYEEGSIQSLLNTGNTLTISADTGAGGYNLEDVSYEVVNYPTQKPDPEPEPNSTDVYVYFQTQNTKGEPVDISGTSIKYNDHSWATLGKISTTQTLTSGETYTGKDNAILNAVGAQAKDNLKDDSLYNGNASIAPTVLEHIQWTKLEQYNGADNYVKAGTTCWHLDGQITGYKVTYATGADEGAVDGMPAASDTYYLSGSDYTVSDATPTRDGCTFAGWKSSNSNDNTVYTAGSTMTMPGEDVTLTAVWEQKETPGTPTEPTKAVDAKYFVLLPGRGTPASGKDQGTSYYLPNETSDGGVSGKNDDTGYPGGLTAEGKNAADQNYNYSDDQNGVFNSAGVPNNYLVVPDDLGFFTASNWKNGQYTKSTNTTNPSTVLGETFNVNNVQIIWYAIKSQGDGYHVDGYVAGIPVTLTYHDNFTGSSESYTQDGLMSGETASIAEDGTVSESKTFSHAGYVFEGWYDNVGCTGTNYAGQTHTMMDNLNLYAKWKKEDSPKQSYTLTVNYIYENGNEAQRPHVEQVEEGTPYTVTSPLIVGYTSDQTVVNGTMPNHDVNVNVRYKANEYTVTYYVNGQLWNADAQKYTVGQSVNVRPDFPKEGYQFSGWSSTDVEIENRAFTMPAKDVIINGSYTKVLNPDPLTYTINQHFMNGKGTEITKQYKEGTSQTGTNTDVLKNLIPETMKVKQTDTAGNTYVYVAEKATFKAGETTLTQDDTLANNTVIDLYYYLDNWKDAGEADKDSETGGDGIPDCDQVLIKYVSSNSDRGTVSPDMEVLTIKDATTGNPVNQGTVTASGSTATATGSSRNYFSNWTRDNTQVSTNATLNNETIQKVIKEFTGGKTYTFTANFGYSSGGGGGGSNRPKPPVVEIPDDVPTGLNGKDHYAYIIGYGNNDVRPQNNITRAEVATIFFRLLTDETREANMTKSNSYNDVKDGDWFCCAVSTLSKMGIIKGYEDGSFKPNDPISRAEFAAIAARFDPDGDKTPASFSDVTSHWAKDEISIAANHGWIKGYEDGSFKPDQKITRAETMTLVNRVLNRLPEAKDDLHKDMKTWVDNMDETAWYYLAVQEATNSHYFKNKTGTKFEQWTDLRDTRDWSELEK